jgi:glucan-binding YG repeat protein
MSGDHAKEMVIGGNKPTSPAKSTSHGKAPSKESGNKKKEGSPSRIRTHKDGEKKKMKKVVYYETDSSSPSTSGSDAASITSKHQERKKYSKIPLRYPRIPRHTPLLSVPLGKPPMFDGEDYSR